MSEGPFTLDGSIIPGLVTGGRAIITAQRIHDAALEALKDAADEIVMPLAAGRAPLLVPENYKRAGQMGGDQGGTPGELRESAKVELEHDENRVALSFDTVYAAIQHERLDWEHPNGQAKYLETSMTETRSQVLDRVAAKLREVTGG